MNDRENESLASGRRVIGLVESKPSGFWPRAIDRPLGEVRFYVKRVDEFLVAQTGGQSQMETATAQVEQLETELRTDLLHPLCTKARRVLRDVPGVAQAFREPKRDIAMDALLAAAEAIAQAAAPYEQRLVDAGLAADFLAQLRAKCAQLRAAIDARAQRRSQRVGATAAVKADLRELRAAIDEIEADIQPLLRKDSALQAEWLSARRIRRKPGGQSSASGNGHVAGNGVAHHVDSPAALMPPPIPPALPPGEQQSQETPNRGV